MSLKKKQKKHRPKKKMVEAIEKNHEEDVMDT